MSEDVISDDQSHYEVSLTAGQAFLAFVLLLLSLAASFAFGLMIGKGQGDERLVAQSSAPSLDEAAPARKSPNRVVELTSDDSAFGAAEAKQEVKQPAKTPSRPAVAATIREELEAAQRTPDLPRIAETAPRTSTPVPAGPAVPHYAQLLSTADQGKAEAFAARLIDGGFMTAYVERSSNAKGPLYRVRVNFRSEQEARAAEARLKTFSSEVWITKQ